MISHDNSTEFQEESHVRSPSISRCSDRRVRRVDYGVEPHDPATLLMVGAVLVLVSAAACMAPARRATAIDPVSVLKAE